MVSEEVSQSRARIINLWLGFTFCTGAIKDVANPFFSVYLVAYGGFTPGLVGLIWFLKEMSQIVSQVPIGWLCDHSTNKKMWLILFATICGLTPLVVFFTLNVPVLIVTKIIEGIATTGLRVLKGPFTLGIAGHGTFESVASKTEIADHSGSLVSAVGAALVAYFLYPNVVALFSVQAMFSLISVFCLAFMRKSKRLSANNGGDLESVESSVINNEWARNSLVTKQSDSDKNESSSGLLKIFSRDNNLAFFYIAVFLFHFGNAAVLPLLSQMLAIDSSREGISLTAANIVIAQLFSVAGVKMMDFFTNRGYRINIPTFIGFGLLIPRILIIFLLLKYWPNQYALIATQVFDGIGAGTNGLALMKVTKELTYGYDCFGVAFALANLSEAFGAGMSNLCSGYVVTAIGYEGGFLFLLVPGVLCPFFILIMKVHQVPDMSGSETEDEDDSEGDPSDLGLTESGSLFESDDLEGGSSPDLVLTESGSSSEIVYEEKVENWSDELKGGSSLDLELTKLGSSSEMVDEEKVENWSDDLEGGSSPDLVLTKSGSSSEIGDEEKVANWSDDAIEPLSYKFEGDPKKLSKFLHQIATRVDDFGWKSIMEILDNDGTPRNLLKNYGQLTMENVKEKALTYQGKDNWDAQVSEMIYICVSSSISKKFMSNLKRFSQDFMFKGKGDGICFIKSIIGFLRADTYSSLGRTLISFNECDNYMRSVNSDVITFNRHVKVQMKALAAFGTYLNDKELIFYLFRGYEASASNTFLNFISQKRDAYEDGEELTAETLMSIAENKFKGMPNMNKFRSDTPISPIRVSIPVATRKGRMANRPRK